MRGRFVLRQLIVTLSVRCAWASASAVQVMYGVPVKCDGRGEEESLVLGKNEFVLGKNGDPTAKPGSSRVTARAGNCWVQREGD